MQLHKFRLRQPGPWPSLEWHFFICKVGPPAGASQVCWVKRDQSLACSPRRGFRGCRRLKLQSSNTARACAHTLIPHAHTHSTCTHTLHIHSLHTHTPHTHSTHPLHTHTLAGTHGHTPAHLLTLSLSLTPIHTPAHAHVTPTPSQTHTHTYALPPSHFTRVQSHSY